MFKIGIYSPDLLYSVGGAHAYALRLGLILSELYPHCSLDFITNRFENIFDEKAQRIRFEEKYLSVFPKNVHIITIKEKKELSFFERLKANFRYKKVSEEYDLFINTFHNLHFFRGTKNIHIIHFPCEKRTKASPTLKKMPFLYPLMRYADIKYKKAYDLFACNSQFTMAWLNKYWQIDKTKQCILYPPIVPIQNTARSDTKKQILILSRIDLNKKIDVLLDAFIKNENQFPDYSLVIAGNCPDYAESAAYLQLLTAKSKNHRVIFRQNLSWNEIKQIITDSEIFWHAMGFGVDEEKNPLKLEHFGMTTVEVMSAGVVPCVINKGGQKEIVDDGVNGFRWNTIEELTEKTLRLIKDNTLLKKMSEAAVKKSKVYTLTAFKNNVQHIMENYNLIPNSKDKTDD
ncbi:glycosyltransferase family 4 protein [Treponema sp. HNW]|uniref:glycosyltransferase family 4 protein n=1 Tax=Treponema sp. HNW TaxID=3116654 RepID=UPI003D1200F9